MGNLENAVFGGGCFWCIEAVFARLAGVKSAESGYMGGRRPNPTYQQVCTGATGHVEVVRVTYDPAEITFRELLDVFFTVHDPTTMNRQGNDVGTQYRSVIFYTSEEQRLEAERVVAELNTEHAFSSPIITAVEPAAEFFRAEDYHQNYFSSNPSQPYCQLIIAPKLRKAEKHFADKLRT